MIFDGGELRLKEKCSRYGINHYVNPNETQAERFSRHQHLEGDCAAECRRRDAERKRNARKHVSNETKQREAQRKREAYHKSEETKQSEAQRKRNDRRHQSELTKQQHEAKRKTILDDNEALVSYINATGRTFNNSVQGIIIGFDNEADFFRVVQKICRAYSTVTTPLKNGAPYQAKHGCIKGGG